MVTGKLLSFAFAWLFLCAVSIAQKADSLKVILQTTKSDTSRSLVLSQLADELSKSAPEEALASARQGLTLALRIGFDAGIFENYAALGATFQDQASYDSSILYFHRAKAVAEKRSDVKGQAEMYSSIAHSFMRKAEMDSSRYHLEKGLQLANQIHDYKIEARLYNLYGNVFLGENNLQDALTYFVKAAKLYDNPLADFHGQSMALANIGNISYRLGNYDQALDYAQQSLAIARQHSFNTILAYVHKMLGRIYRQQKKYDEALSEYRHAEELHLKENDTRSASEVLQNIGNIYFDQGQYRNALANYQQSLGLAKSISMRWHTAYAYSSIGMTYTALKQSDKALPYLDSARMDAIAIEDAYLLMDTYEAISSAYAAKGDYRNALTMHQNFVQMKDSVTRLENRQQTEEIQAKYELEKKEARIALLEKDQELSAVDLGRQRAIQLAAVITAALGVVITLLLVNRYRISNRAKRQAEIEHVRNTIARDLHDDIGSALSTINIISKLAIHENPGGHNTHLNRIADQSSRMMESMTDMVWSINPLNDSLERVAVKMKVFANEILEPQNISYRFNGEETLGGVTLDAEKKKNLFLIFKETINNAAKYSQATEVDIALIKSDGRLVMTVSDNGQGFAPQDVSEGNGLRNMDTRARVMNAQIKVTSGIGKGTRVELDLPIT